MYTLHIEHLISDADVWSSAFAAFAGARRDAGAVGERVRTALDDPLHIVIDLDFPDEASAEQFRSFLESTVWADPTLSPALDGRPRTRILASLDLLSDR